MQALASQKRATKVGVAHGLWVAAERLPEVRAVHPGAGIDPEIDAPAEYARKDWTREQALVEIVRGRLEGLGPVIPAALAQSLAVPVGEVDSALAALEAEGFAMRGSYTPSAAGTEWCERALLARIHRYTLNRLRKEIEPVSAADFMRFLFDWQRVSAGARMEGPDAVAAVVSQLEGYEAAAAAWETALLPARVTGYDPGWLDDLCLAGRIVWTRLDGPRPNIERSQGPAPVRSTPVALMTRKNLALWTSLVRTANGESLRLSSRAQQLADYLAEHGASFFDDIAAGLDTPRTFVEDALRELVAAGLVNSDGFSGLRALLLPAHRRKPVLGGGKRRRTALFGVEDAGRWALIRRKSPAAGAANAFPRETVEQVARTLLRRYGVVFWRMLAREADWLPPWRELLMACRRLEARGEIRGGRFVAGFSGEQFALPEAVGLLRNARNEGQTGRLTAVNGADPLNLVGIVVPGAKVPALYGNRVLYRDGAALAALVAGEVVYYETVPPEQAWEIRGLLVRSQAPEGLAALM
jgi:ATP-dependent Lhr-like helicase